MKQKQKHTTGGIPRWSPTLVLVARFSAYVWQSGRDAQFSLTYGRIYQYFWYQNTRSYQRSLLGCSRRFFETNMNTSTLSLNCVSPHRTPHNKRNKRGSRSPSPQALTGPSQTKLAPVIIARYSRSTTPKYTKSQKPPGNTANSPTSSSANASPTLSDKRC
jgi:hypothetical protein